MRHLVVLLFHAYLKRNSDINLNWLVSSKTCVLLQISQFVQKSVRNYELLEISVFCQEREEINNLTKYSHSLI